MKVTGFFSAIGAIILLAALGVVAAKPQIVSIGLSGFNQILSTAVRG